MPEKNYTNVTPQQEAFETSKYIAQIAAINGMPPQRVDQLEAERVFRCITQKGG